MNKKTVFSLLAGVLTALCLPGFVAAQARSALVIGNGAYQSLGRLVNPPNAAADFAAALRANGFKTTLPVDAGQQRMEEAVLAFRTELLRDAQRRRLLRRGVGVRGQGRPACIRSQHQCPGKQRQ